jgi:RHS repeat-associated protein
VGWRRTKTVNGVPTEFLYDEENPVQELGVDEYFSRTDVLGTRSFLPDALGSVLALTDAAGTVQTEYTYEPFGQTTVTGAASGNPSQYTGRENDGTGLYYYRARYYHPGLQRFISEDPIEFRGGDPNLYGYVRNNPINLVDPTGLLSIEGGIGATVGPVDVTYGSGGLGASLTTPGLGAGGFLCFNICDDPASEPPSCPGDDEPIEPLPLTYSAGPRRLGISFTDDWCQICINFGPAIGLPINVSIPISVE